MSEFKFFITATRNGKTAYYNAFDLMVNPNVLLTTPDLASAFPFTVRQAAESRMAWLKNRFPEYEYAITEQPS